MARWERRLEELGSEYDLGPAALAALGRLLVLLRDDHHAPTPVREPGDAVDVHVADSLVGLEVPVVSGAASLADLGAGAGFPGLVLAAARPRARVVLVESVGRRAAWLAGATEAMGLGNVEVVPARVEQWRGGEVAVVTARALAPLAVLVEYAAPILAPGGSLVAWKGAPEAREEADGRAAAVVLGLEAPQIVPVEPFHGIRDRRLYVYSKVRQTPPGYPRRPGMAAKRPLRADPEARVDAFSDRRRR